MSDIDNRIHLYSEKEERLNALTHGLSALAAAIMLVLMLLRIRGESPLSKGAFLTFSVLTLLVYSVSTVYHGVKNIEKKIIWQKLDHSMVSLIIAGTAAPALLVLSKGLVAYIMFALVALATVANVVLNLISVKKYKKPSQLLYLAAVIFIIVGMIAGANKLSAGFWWLFLAGLGVIIIGGGFYMKKSIKYTHVVWHIADITASVLHFLAFYLFVLK